MLDRQEHIQWCKDRALEYIKNNDLTNAIASMISDLSKHEETRDHPATSLLMTIGSTSLEEAKKCIEGFN